MVFDNGSSHFFVALHGTIEADGFASQSLDVRYELQVVTLDALGEYLPGQMFLARDFSGVAPPVMLVLKPIWNGASRLSKWRHRPIGNDSFSLGIKG